MKKTNQRQKRVAALSLATIISLNMTNIALAEPNIAIPEVSTSVEVKEIKEKEKIQEVEETESLEVEEIQTLEIEDEKEEESLEIEGKRPQDKEQKEEVKEPKTYIKKNGKTELESFSIKGNLEGKSIQTLEAGASSVNGVLYKFYIKDLSTNKWTMIQDYSEENTATWVPEKAGNYWYGVHIKDKESKEAKDTHLYKNVTIKSGPLISLTDFTISGRRYTSQNHTLTADAVSDNGVLYKFYIKDLSTNKWTMIQDYSEKNTATWKPKKAGNYWYGVHIKDKKSKEAKDTHLYKNVTIKPVTSAEIDNFTISGGRYEKNGHSLTANASSANGVLYKFYIKDLSTNKWTIIQDYSEKNTATWKPEKPGKYWYGVHIKDKKSDKSKDTHLYKNVTIKPVSPAEIDNFTISGGRYEKNGHRLTANASSVNGVLYKFYIKDLSTNKWTMIQDYSEKNTARWYPDKPGDYWYGVHIKDKKSKEAKDAHLYRNVTIKPTPPAKLEDFTISGLGYEKKNHTLKANASSVNGVLYKFYIKDLKTNKWKVIQDYSEKDTATWKPKKPGKYWYGVHIKDKRSDKSKDTHLYKTFTVNPPVYYNTSNYGDTIDEALNKQVGKNTISKNGKWVPATKDEIKNYLNPDRFLQFEPKGEEKPNKTSGIITTSSLNVRSGPSVSYGKIGTVLKGQTHKLLKESNGWYQINLNGKKGWISGDYVRFGASIKGEDQHILSIEINTGSLRVRKEANTTSAILSTVKNGEVYVVLDNKNGWYKINVGGKKGWVSGNYVKLVNDVPRNMYQFMVLSGQAGVTSAQMNKELVGKGILTGKGAAFIEGSKKYNINELYLMAHAFLETGKGTSRLAKGIVVSEVDGKQVTPRKVYNMYGIGARDKDAERLGSEKAYKEGWFTPEKAITEGAHWISKNYINNKTYKQDTLYKMKYNPASPGTHQYATDIAWPIKQTTQIDAMMEICRKMDGAILRFDVPKYR